MVDTVACRESTGGKQRSQRSGPPGSELPTVGQLRSRLGWWNACGWWSEMPVPSHQNPAPGVVADRSSLRTKTACGLSQASTSSTAKAAADRVEPDHRPEQPAVGHTGRAGPREDDRSRRVVDDEGRHHPRSGDPPPVSIPATPRPSSAPPRMRATIHPTWFEGDPISAWMTTDGVASRAQPVASSTIALTRSMAGRNGQAFLGCAALRLMCLSRVLPGGRAIATLPADRLPRVTLRG